MDFLSKRTIDITTLAMDGLAARHKALTANIANANTPGYKRVDVSFEGKLRDILNIEYEKDRIKSENSDIAMAQHFRETNSTQLGLRYNPSSEILNLNNSGNSSRVNPQLLQDNYKNFSPDIVPDNDFVMEKQNGNNVNIESEMVESAKVGTQYSALAQFQEKSFRGILDVIKGGGA